MEIVDTSYSESIDKPYRKETCHTGKVDKPDREGRHTIWGRKHVIWGRQTHHSGKVTCHMPYRHAIQGEG